VTVRDSADAVNPESTATNDIVDVHVIR
jgi:hypothetical protein